MFQSIEFQYKFNQHALYFAQKSTGKCPFTHTSDNPSSVDNYSEDRKQRQEKFYQEMKAISPEGQMALQEIYTLATRVEGDLGFHAYYARILGGKYPEIQPLLLQEALALEMVSRGNEEEAEESRQKRKDFQIATKRLCTEAPPNAPNYIPVKDISKADQKVYFEAFKQATQKAFDDIKQKHPVIQRRR